MNHSVSIMAFISRYDNIHFDFWHASGHKRHDLSDSVSSSRHETTPEKRAEKTRRGSPERLAKFRDNFSDGLPAQTAEEMHPNSLSSEGLVPRLEPNPDELISESEVLRLRPVVAKTHLRVARKRGIIRWTKGKRGSAWYRLTDVDAYLKTYREIQCPNPEKIRSMNWADSGSQPSPIAECSIDFGLSREQEEHVAQALARRI